MKSFFELFINKIFEFTFVTFKSEQTIVADFNTLNVCIGNANRI